MVSVRAAVKSTGVGLFYTIAIFLITLGFDWMQNLDIHPWYAGLIMIFAGFAVFVVDRYLNLEAPPQP